MSGAPDSALRTAQEALIDAIAAADHAAIRRATESFRSALRAPAPSDASPESLATQRRLAAVLQARLGQTRLALDALGLHARDYDRHGRIAVHRT